jgi:REP element-mobilizing transposase RayT
VSILSRGKCAKINYIHLLAEIPPNLKYKYGNRHFWCRGYYVDTAGKNAKKIQEYIQNQLKEDLEYDQMTLKEYIDPFTGEPVKANH